jgi:hypothetical protein
VRTKIRNNMAEKDEIKLFQELTEAAESQIKETLERLLLVCSERAGEAATAASDEAVAKVADIEQGLRQFLSDSTARAELLLNDAIKISEEVRGGIAEIEVRIEAQVKPIEHGVVKILDAQQNVIQALADSAAALSKNLQGATEVVEIVRQRIDGIESRMVGHATSAAEGGAKILDAQHNILGAIAGSGAAALKGMQDATKIIEDTNLHVDVLAAEVKGQSSLIRKMLIGLWVAVFVIIALIGVVFVR